MSKLVKATVLLKIEDVHDWTNALMVAFRLAGGPALYGRDGHSAYLREVLAVEGYTLPSCVVCGQEIPDGYSWGRIPGTNDVRHAGCKER